MIAKSLLPLALALAGGLGANVPAQANDNARTEMSRFKQQKQFKKYSRKK